MKAAQPSTPMSRSAAWHEVIEPDEQDQKYVAPVELGARFPKSSPSVSLSTQAIECWRTE
jgi:hypothetical protein